MNIRKVGVIMAYKKPDRDGYYYQIYCSNETADFIEDCLKKLGIDYGKSHFFVRAVVKEMKHLGFEVPPEVSRYCTSDTDIRGRKIAKGRKGMVKSG